MNLADHELDSRDHTDWITVQNLQDREYVSVSQPPIVGRHTTHLVRAPHPCLKQGTRSCRQLRETDSEDRRTYQYLFRTKTWRADFLILVRTFMEAYRGHSRIEHDAAITRHTYSLLPSLCICPDALHASCRTSTASFLSRSTGLEIKLQFA